MVLLNTSETGREMPPRVNVVTPPATVASILPVAVPVNETTFPSGERTASKVGAGVTTGGAGAVLPLLPPPLEARAPTASPAPATAATTPRMGNVLLPAAAPPAGTATNSFRMPISPGCEPATHSPAANSRTAPSDSRTIRRPSRTSHETAPRISETAVKPPGKAAAANAGTSIAVADARPAATRWLCRSSQPPT